VTSQFNHNINIVLPDHREDYLLMAFE